MFNNSLKLQIEPNLQPKKQNRLPLKIKNGQMALTLDSNSLLSMIKWHLDGLTKTKYKLILNYWPQLIRLLIANNLNLMDVKCSVILTLLKRVWLSLTWKNINQVWLHNLVMVKLLSDIKLDHLTLLVKNYIKNNIYSKLIVNYLNPPLSLKLKNNI